MLDWPVLRAHWRIVLLLGALGIGAFNTLLYTGLQTTTAFNAMLIQSAQPALILLIGALEMRDRTRVRQIACMAVSVAGVLLLIACGDIYAVVTLRINTCDARHGSAAVWRRLSSDGRPGGGERRSTEG